MPAMAELTRNPAGWRCRKAALEAPRSASFPIVSSNMTAPLLRADALGRRFGSHEASGRMGMGIRAAARAATDGRAGGAGNVVDSDGIGAESGEPVRDPPEKLWARRLHAHDVPALRGEAERETVGIALPGDRHALRLAAGELEDAGRDQVVEKDRFGRVERADLPQRQLLGIEGTDAEERDPAAGRRVCDPRLRQ